MAEALPSFYALIPCLGVVVVAAVAAMRARRRGRHGKGGGGIGPAALAWAILFCALLAGMAVLVALGMAACDIPVLALFSVVATCGGLLSLVRTPVLDFFDRADKNWHPVPSRIVRFLRDGVLLGIAAFLAVAACELPWNIYYLPPDTRGLVACVVMAFVVLLVLYLLFQHRGAGPALGVTAMAFIGIAQYFVVKFKGEPISPGDLMALGTAMEVSQGYVYTFSTTAVLGLTCFAAALIPLLFLRPSKAYSGKQVALRAVANVVAAAVLCAGLGSFVMSADAFDKAGLWAHYWLPSDNLQSSYNQGLAPTFFYKMQRMGVEKPEGYSTERAEELLDQYARQGQQVLKDDAVYAATRAQYDKEQPSIVIVMEESFADMSIYDGLGVGYEGPTYFTQGMDALVRGSAFASMFGGGTCNSEFEMFTGVSMGFVGQATHPYVMYDMSGTTTIVHQLASLGYETTAIHPAGASNWYRDRVYEQFGFDRFISEGDFVDPEYYGTYIRDSETFDKVIEVLEQDGPQFVFDLTIQNHSDYAVKGIPEQEQRGYVHEADEIAQADAELNAYLACVDTSDYDIEQFLDKLRALDKPVIVAFFGDHQPGFARPYNDYFASQEEEGLAHSQRAFQTLYAVWANYDLAGWSGDDAKSGSEEAGRHRQESDVISMNYIGTQTMRMAGVPLADWQLADVAMREKVRAVNIDGYYDKDGQWYRLTGDEAGPDRTLVEDMRTLKYYFFGSAVS